MKDEKETKEKLILSARTEFIENGYMKASLRSICKNAGVTTGALYFFFKDKNDLFSSIVSKPLNELMSTLEEHFRDDELLLSNPNWIKDDISIHENNHDNLQYQIVKILYANYDIFVMLLTKAQGSEYESLTEQLVDNIEIIYKKMLLKASEDNKVVHVNDYMIHWLSHMCIDAFTHLLLYEKDEEQALKYVDRIMHYIIKGWMELLIYED